MRKHPPMVGGWVFYFWGTTFDVWRVHFGFWYSLAVRTVCVEPVVDGVQVLVRAFSPPSRIFDWSKWLTRIALIPRSFCESYIDNLSTDSGKEALRSLLEPLENRWGIDLDEDPNVGHLIRGAM